MHVYSGHTIKNQYHGSDGKIYGWKSVDAFEPMDLKIKDLVLYLSGNMGTIEKLSVDGDEFILNNGSILKRSSLFKVVASFQCGENVFKAGDDVLYSYGGRRYNRKIKAIDESGRCLFEYDEYNNHYVPIDTVEHVQ